VQLSLARISWLKINLIARLYDMKLTDFGLWFWEYSGRDCKWSATVPRQLGYGIYYDGELLGDHLSNFDLELYCDLGPYTIILKSKLPLREGRIDTYTLYRPITLEDFEIVKNPDYNENQ
jgi:hypothetical protein